MQTTSHLKKRFKFGVNFDVNFGVIFLSSESVIYTGVEMLVLMLISGHVLFVCLLQSCPLSLYGY